MKKIFMLGCIFALVLSCSDDIDKIDDIQSFELKNRNNLRASVFNGILKFDSQDDLDNTIQFIENSDDLRLKSTFDQLYQEGFEPLYFYTDDDDFATDLLFKRNDYLPESLRQEDDFDVTDELIFADDFASLLNYKRQIIIDDKIYMFTFSGALVGDYRDHEQAEIIALNNGLNEQILEPPLTTSNIDLGNGFNLVSEPLSDGPCISEGMPVLCYPPIDTPPSGWVFPTPINLDNTFEHVVQNSSNLEFCNDRSSTYFFGTRRVCSKPLLNREQRRTRVEFTYTRILEIYRRYKLETKHQRKRGIIIKRWTKDKADEIGMLINNATFYMDNSNFGNNAPTNLPNDIAHYYYVDGFNLTYTDLNPLNFGSMSAPLYGTSNNFQKPNSPFGEDMIIHVVSSNLPVMEHEHPTDQAEILLSYFNNNIFERANQTWGQHFTNYPRTYTIIYSTNTRTIVQHIDYQGRFPNKSRVRRTLDSSFNGKIGFTVTVPPDGQQFNPVTGITNIEDFSWNSPLEHLWDYDSHNIDFVGYSRKDTNESFVRFNQFEE